jgi:sugar phosphate isomerase/epimerase
VYKALAPGAIGVKVPFEEAVHLAATHDFQGIAVGMPDVKRLGIDGVRQLLGDHDLAPALTGMPVDFRGDEATFKRDLANLAVFAEAMSELGCTRVATWLRPWHETLPYDVHFEQVRHRTELIARVLAKHGMRYGLEFVGPETLRRGKPNPFIHDIDGLLALIRATRASNLGILLDSFHWYTSGGSGQDLDGLSDDLVVVVHVNDAIVGLSRQEQMDSVRALPGETGVIDIATFMRALDRMGYSGPVVVEPFSQRIRAMAPSEAVAATGQSLDKIWEIAGI